MAPTANDNAEPEEDLPPEAIAQLVAYDEAKLTDTGTNGDTPNSLCHVTDLSPELACVDLLHRVWPTTRPKASVRSEHCVPEIVGDLRLVRELGRGGMGIVYEAEQLSLGRRVAVKLLPYATLFDDKSLQRFRNEVRAAAALDHPHIVAVYGAGEDGGHHYFTMQLIRGRTLAEVIGELRSTKSAAEAPRHDSREASPKPPIPSLAGIHGTAEFYRTVAQWGAEACSALQHAHEVGVLHRDIKPGNLMLDDAGQLHVTDFGLARIGEDAGLTMTGDIVGTLRYMAPEQSLGKKVILDQRADIYALGATLYELLTLEPVFGESDRAILLSQIAFHEPVPLRKQDPRIPIDLETIALKALAKAQAERYQSAASMAADLRAFLDERPITARRASIVDRTRRWMRHHKNLTRTAIASCVVLTVMLAFSTFVVRQAENRATAALNQTSRLLYTADTALAYQAFNAGRPEEARNLLDRHQPTEATGDLRGVEWHLLNMRLPRVSPVTLTGHQGAVTELAVFPDRRRVASVGDDGTLRIWDTTSHTLVRTIPLSPEPLYSVAISPDGHLVAAGNEVIYLCDVEGGKPVRNIFRGEHKVESLAFHPQGDRLAAGMRYDKVCRLDLDGHLQKEVPCASRVLTLEFTPDGTSLLFPNRSGKNLVRHFIELWKADLSSVQQKFERGESGAAGLLTHARCSPDGKYVAGGEYYRNKTKVFEAATGRIITETPVSRDAVADLAYAPDGQTLAVGYFNGQLEWYDLAEEPGTPPQITRPPLVISAHQGQVRSVRYLSNDALVSAGNDGLIKIWKMHRCWESGYDLADERLRDVGASPDGRLLAAAYDSQIVIAETATGQILVRSNKKLAGCGVITWSPQGDQVAVACTASKTVEVLDAKGNRNLSIKHAAAANDIAFSFDGKQIAMTGGRQFCIYDAGDGHVLFEHSLVNPGYSTAFSHDGHRVAYGGEEDGIAVLDRRRGGPALNIRATSDVYCLAFSPDDRLLAAGLGDSSIRVWNVETGAFEFELVGHQGRIGELAFSPDGRTLLSNAADGTVRVWAVDARRAYGILYQRYPQDDKAAWCHLGLSSNGQTLVLSHATEVKGSPDVYVWRLPQDVPEGTMSK